MDIKPIPAFYCCYLLRSTVRHSSLYIGSSPDPARRLAQHNGRVQGGAVRTSRASLRPWEMACIVAGFPSNIAALQFEWAWHNSHLTRHITPTERISFATTRLKTTKSGKTSKRPGRPRTSQIDKLSNLHLLLRVPYFSRWPLHVRFFNKDVYRAWLTWCGRVDTQIRSGINVIFDPVQSETASAQDEEEFTSAQPVRKKRKADLIGKGGVEGVDPTYARLRDVLQKTRLLLDENHDFKCSTCTTGLNPNQDMFILCPNDACHNVNHVTCLADRALAGADSNTMVPQEVSCPSCRASHSWLELMQQVTVKTRGVKEMAKLLKKKGKGQAATAAEILETEDEDDDDEMDNEAIDTHDVIDEDVVRSDDDHDDDRGSVASMDSDFSQASNLGPSPSKAKSGSRLEIVIEDSEDES